MGDFILEINNSFGIDGESHETGLKMEVRTGRASGVTAFCNKLTGTNALSGAHKGAGEVSIDSFKSVVMAHYDIMSVTSGFVFYNPDFSVKSRDYRVADMEVEVNPAMHAAEAGTPSVRGGELSANGNHKTGYIDVLCGRNFKAGVGVDRLRFEIIVEQLVVLKCLTTAHIVCEAVDFGGFYVNAGRALVGNEIFMLFVV